MRFLFSFLLILFISPAYAGSPATFNWSVGTFGCNQGAQNVSGSGSAICSTISSLTATAYTLCGWGPGAPTYKFDQASSCIAENGDSKQLVVQSCPGGTEFSQDYDGELALPSWSCNTVAPDFDCPPGQVADTFTLGGTLFNTCAPPLEDPCVVLGYSGDEAICAPPGEPELCLGAGGAYGLIDGVGKCVFGEPEQPLPPEIPECSSGYILVEAGGTATCKKVFALPPQIEDLDNPDSGGTPDGSGGTVGGSGGTFSADIDGDGIINVLDPDIDGDGIINTLDPDIDGDGFNNDVDTDIDGDGVNNDRDNDIDGDGVNNGADNDIDGDGINNDTDTDDDGDGVSDGDDAVPGGSDGGEEGTEGEQSVSGGGNCDPASQPTCDGGEPILCAILVQNWRTQCALNEEVDFESEFADYIADNAPGNLYQPDEDLSSTLTGIFNQSAGDQSCPPGVPLNLLGTSFTFDYAPICDVADGIRPIMLVIFSLLGFRVLMRAFS